MEEYKNLPGSRSRSRGQSQKGFEVDTSEQMNLPGFSKVQGLGEDVFLLLARKWCNDFKKINENDALPESLDLIALSCLLLSLEWGKNFTESALFQIEKSYEVAEARRHYLWHNQLSWQLCESAFVLNPTETEAVNRLTANLNHHNSSIRCWMLKIAWIIRPWLDPSKALPLLFENLSDALMGPFMSAGLAAAIIGDRNDDLDKIFFEKARNFNPSHENENQFQDRIMFIKENGIYPAQAPFWRLESHCWRIIVRAAFDEIGEP
jgi:hypothetical protein